VVGVLTAAPSPSESPRPRPRSSPGAGRRRLGAVTWSAAMVAAILALVLSGLLFVAGSSQRAVVTAGAAVDHTALAPQLAEVLVTQLESQLGASPGTVPRQVVRQPLAAFLQSPEGRQVVAKLTAGQWELSLGDARAVTVDLRPELAAMGQALSPSAPELASQLDRVAQFVMYRQAPQAVSRVVPAATAARAVLAAVALVLAAVSVLCDRHGALWRLGRTSRRLAIAALALSAVMAVTARLPLGGTVGWVTLAAARLWVPCLALGVAAGVVALAVSRTRR
jgi:hypothetical protein